MDSKEYENPSNMIDAEEDWVDKHIAHFFNIAGPLLVILPFF
jgi:hypothetical protein